MVGEGEALETTAKRSGPMPLGLAADKTVQPDRLSQQVMRAACQAKQVHRGQTLVIFALTLSVLLAILGLALDTIHLYDLYARMQRAADAGALAGVIYLPNNYDTPLIVGGDGQSAVSRAVEATIQNGFGTPISPTSSGCSNPAAQREVEVCRVATKPADLRVTITCTVNLLGVQVSRSR